MRLAGTWLIKMGLLVLSFAAYQLWGTGLFQAQSQLQLAADFDELVVTIDDSSQNRNATSSDLADAAPPLADRRDTSNIPTSVQIPIEIMERQAGEVAARLLIPKIGLEEYVVEGVGSDELKQGPGHYPGTPMPGMAGNASLAGHRTTWGAPFGRINELDPGDRITVEMPWGSAEYEVEGHDDGAGGQQGYFIVDPSEVWVLDQDGDNRLTLTSCQPKYSARQRIIVTARLVTPPVFVADQQPDSPDINNFDNDGFEVAQTDSTFLEQPDPTEKALPSEQFAGFQPQPSERAPALSEQDSFGAGLGGDPSARTPALLLTLTAIATWLAIEALARRWRGPLVYAGAALPFAGLWFAAFTFIDRAIPSY